METYIVSKKYGSEAGKSFEVLAGNIDSAAYEALMELGWEIEAKSESEPTSEQEG